MWKEHEISLIPAESMSDNHVYVYKHTHDSGAGPNTLVSLNEKLDINTFYETEKFSLLFTRKRNGDPVRQYTSHPMIPLGVGSIHKSIVKKWFNENRPTKVIVNEDQELIHEELRIEDVIFIDSIYDFNAVKDAFNANIPDWVDENVATNMFVSYLKSKDK